MTNNLSLIDQISEATDYQREHSDKIGKELVCIFITIDVFLLVGSIYLSIAFNTASLFLTIPAIIISNLLFYLVYKIFKLRRVEESIHYTTISILETIRLYKHDEILEKILDTIDARDLRYNEGKDLLKNIDDSFSTRITELLKNRKIEKKGYINYENRTN